MSDLFGEELDSGSRCELDHPLMLVAEGYAICHDEGFAGWEELWWVWRLTPPRVGGWVIDPIRGRDELPIMAWVYRFAYPTKGDAIAAIQADMDAHRALPFDEDAERARLMPV